MDAAQVLRIRLAISITIYFEELTRSSLSFHDNIVFMIRPPFCMARRQMEAMKKTLIPMLDIERRWWGFIVWRRRIRFEWLTSDAAAEKELHKRAQQPSCGERHKFWLDFDVFITPYLSISQARAYNINRMVCPPNQQFKEIYTKYLVPPISHYFLFPPIHPSQSRVLKWQFPANKLSSWRLTGSGMPPSRPTITFPASVVPVCLQFCHNHQITHSFAPPRSFPLCNLLCEHII